MDASATLSSPAIIRWINDPEVKVSADTQALCSVGEKAFIVFEQEAGSSEGDSWMEIEYAIFFHLAKSCPWAVPGLNFFFSSCHLCLIRPSHLPSILSRKLPSKLISTFTNKYNGNMRGEKNLGLWWIRAVRCFQVSFVFVLLPVRFFVFPPTGNNAPAHSPHGPCLPSQDMATTWCHHCVIPALHHCEQTATAYRLSWPFTPVHNWSCGDTACPKLLVIWVLQPRYRSVDLPLIFFTLLLLFSLALFSWWTDPSSPCSDRSARVIGMSPWPMFCVSAMSPLFHGSIALMSHCYVTWPQTNVSHLSWHPHPLLYHNPLKYHLPAHCQLFLIPFAVDSVIHCALTWDPHGFRHHAPPTPILFTSRTIYNSHLLDCRQTQCKTHLKWTRRRREADI